MNKYIAIVPAAGIGSRMQADRPKQYLLLQSKTILEHTVERLLSHPQIEQVVVAISATDDYFATTTLASNSRVIQVLGGKERSDSVLNALQYLHAQNYSGQVLVHDAARPNIDLGDISALIEAACQHPTGAILASRVKDTMKRSDGDSTIIETVSRVNLWHALTPQMFDAVALRLALHSAVDQNQVITDEASAMELIGEAPMIVEGRADNIKVTQPEDFSLMGFYLSQSSKGKA
ncbi:2-C-methyl-D-erythritol 4-phosphate cytidylyltransferase [Vibrio gallicus]|uniref:2-C-methyl-D-erythritol 4-phosphate cytidylyltransferase n=1 Tax=Vibrio gallicus TaxID=190897 RepID=UPI0021C26A8D|nr:2-C-methyl-D-erythritol 4-phosphate cytidylyltransferase [Vibrio gallicus]